MSGSTTTSIDTELAIARNELSREKQKNRALFFVIGGVICFETSRIFTDIHELLTMAASAVAVVLSLYGFFNYFESYRRHPDP